MKLRTYKADDEVYDPARETADALGDSLSQIIRDALIDYTQRNARRARAAARRKAAHAGD